MLIISHHLILIIENNCLVLSEGPAEGINDQLKILMEKCSINFISQTQNIRSSLHYNDNEIYLYVNKAEIWNLRRIIT